MTSSSRAKPRAGELALQPLDVAVQHRLDRGVDRRGRAALVLAVLGDDGVAGGHVAVRPERAHDLGGARLVRRVDVAVQEVDDDALRAELEQLRSRAAATCGLVERHAAPRPRRPSARRPRAGRCRSISGTKRPFRPYGVGRVRRPSSSTSRKPRVVIRPTVAILRSSIALVVVVVPWTIASSAAGSTPAAASAARTPKAWLSTVVGTLAMRTSPLAVVDDDQVGEGAADVDAGDASVAASPGAPRGSPRGARRSGTHAEVGAQQRLVAHQRLHRAVELHLALLEHDGAVGDQARRSAGSAPRAGSRRPAAFSATIMRAISSTIIGATPSDGSSSSTR